MRIFIINNYAIPPAYGGLNRHYYFAREWVKAGHQVKILTASQIHNTTCNMIEPRQLISERDMDGVAYSFVRTISYRKNNWRRMASMLQFAWNSLRAVKRLSRQGQKPDLIYLSSPSPFSCLTNLYYAKRHKIPCILEVRDLWPLSIVNFSTLTDHNILVKILYKLEKWLYRRADRLVFTMAGGVDYIRQQAWQDQVALEKIYHINNGVDIADFQSELRAHPATDPDLTNPDKFKLVFTGSIRHIYQLDLIVEAARLTAETLPDLLYLIYGDGPERDRLQAMVDRYKLSNIKFKGKVDKKYVPGILAQADLALLHARQVKLNRYGVSPNKLFEYAAAQKPIFSTIKTAYSLIDRYSCGLELEDQSADKIAWGLTYFYNLDRSQLRSMGHRAYQLAKDHDYHRLAEKLLLIFRDLVENSKGP